MKLAQEVFESKREALIEAIRINKGWCDRAKKVKAVWDLCVEQFGPATRGRGQFGWSTRMMGKLLTEKLGETWSKTKVADDLMIAEIVVEHPHLCNESRIFVLESHREGLLKKRHGGASTSSPFKERGDMPKDLTIIYQVLTNKGTVNSDQVRAWATVIEAEGFKLTQMINWLNRVADLMDSLEDNEF